MAWGEPLKHLSYNCGSQCFAVRRQIQSLQVNLLLHPMAPTPTWHARCGTPVPSVHLLPPHTHRHPLSWVDPLPQQEFSRLFINCPAILGGVGLLRPQCRLCPLCRAPILADSVPGGCTWAHTTFTCVSSFLVTLNKVGAAIQELAWKIIPNIMSKNTQWGKLKREERSKEMMVSQELD